MMAGIKVKRFENNPLIYPELDASMGTNIAGPSLIRAPTWLDKPLGKYYLYFAGHKGTYIRLAHAEKLEGPWKIYKKGTLHVKNSYFPSEPPEQKMKFKSNIQDESVPHIASPDVHVIEDAKEIRMYYHGLESNGRQLTRVAISKDGIHFKAKPEILTPSYLRVFHHEGYYYGMSMPGIFYRSQNGLNDFEMGVRLFRRTMRHSALRIDRNQLQVFWTRVGDTPERILLSFIDMTADWSTWKASAPIEVLRPEMEWEGGDLEPISSIRGPVYERVCQLRDPAVYEENNKKYLLYSIAGERGIAIAELLL